MLLIGGNGPSIPLYLNTNFQGTQSIRNWSKLSSPYLARNASKKGGKWGASWQSKYPDNSTLNSWIDKMPSCAVLICTLSC